MGWYRRSSRLIFDAFRCYNPKIVLQPRNAIIQQSVSARFFSSKTNSKIYEFPSPWSNPYRHLANRSYHRSSYHVDKQPSYVSMVVLVGLGVWITVHFGDLETVPYTKRSHCVLLSNSLEKDVGETLFENRKTQYQGNILPPLDPYSIRAQRIANNIIDGLKKEQKQGKEKQGMEKQGKEKQGMKSHVEGFNWEIIVVNDPMISARCFPGGKIVVFTGLLNRFTEDAEVATIIGREVGHALARHTAEETSEALWRLIVFYWFFTNTSITMTLSVMFVSKFFSELPFSRRLEIEADYIGVMLAASAGYDPRVAPQVLKKLGNSFGDSVLNDYISSHPSYKKRVELLGEAKVMEEALNIYREVQAERGAEASL